MLGPVRTLLGSARRALVSRVDALLHPRRRRAALARVAGAGPVRSVLVVCLGNICRSPYAAARIDEAVGETVSVVSAGFVRAGRPSPEEAIAEARSRGLDLSSHRSEVVTADAVAEADLVVLVDPGHRTRLSRRVGAPAAPVVLLGDLDPLPVTRRAIADPWGGDAELFRDTFDRIDRCVVALLRALS